MQAQKGNPMAIMPEAAVSASAPAGTRAALDVRHLSTSFRTKLGPLPAVNDVSFTVERGRALAVIGESGSGKSAMLRSILGTQPRTATTSGEVFVNGREVLSLPARERSALRGREISMVFQDPMTALDPVYTIEQQLGETIRQHLGSSRAEARSRALELMERVEIPSAAQRLSAYPFEMSGGMRQRVVIAMAIAAEPAVLLADEPTTALDVTVQSRILRLFKNLQRSSDLAVVVVTHDLGVAAEIADDVAVMYAGRIVEFGPVRQILESPDHPYTRALIEANVRPGQRERPRAIVGAPPRLTRLPDGCAFAPRCDVATVECWSRQPSPVQVAEAHSSRCLLSRREGAHA
jgi:oligopeptide/dipeptide ABC transporter ATP-binding protein